MLQVFPRYPPLLPNVRWARQSKPCLAVEASTVTEKN